MSHPPNTVNGRFRVTEQGEMDYTKLLAPHPLLSVLLTFIDGELFSTNISTSTSSPTRSGKQMQRSRMSVVLIIATVQKSPGLFQICQVGHTRVGVGQSEHW
jgi:phosphoenolpyruvate carboxylase